ncbi:hypothetical protein C7447_1074 [Tenacibaculum adriaticum]|uniref:UbiA prenyltransferase family protein n=1 Tax=Tenacibaculum adriaticum TaxID=413713 RepID=A0A5S5DM32_9FLAO|nr:hypothetical protein [Tenacibaculum adriaticum]TYP96438.1 hypothetical protein C7447_1074 [Tenacibaculum adriaticum]
MKLLKTLFDFYINSSIHVALAVYALVRITEVYFNLSYNEPLDYFIFYGTITGYNFIKYAGVAKLHHRSLTENLKIIQVFSLICFVLMLFYGRQLKLNTLLFFIPFGVLTLLYAIPFLKGLTKNLRNVASLKIMVIALVWAGTTVLLPVLDAELPINSKVVLQFIQRILFVIVLTLPFDIRDLQFDQKQLQTLPQLLGVERAKKLGFILLAITMIIEFFISPNSNFKTTFLIVFFVLLVFLQRAKRKQTKYYTSFWVEAIPIFWYVLLLVILKN